MSTADIEREDAEATANDPFIIPGGSVWAARSAAPGGLLRGDPLGRSVQVPIRLEAHPEPGGGVE